jgi:hypothetical protein
VSDPVPSWQALRDEEDRKVLESGHAGLCSRARRMMPHLSAEDAAEMRRAIFAGPSSNLDELVLRHWKAVYTDRGVRP